MKEQGTWSRTHPQLFHAADEEAVEEAAEEEAAEEEGDAEDIQH